MFEQNPGPDIDLNPTMLKLPGVIHEARNANPLGYDYYNNQWGRKPV